MAKIFTFISIFIVVFSSINCEQRPLLRYSNYIQKAIPNHWQYDEEKLSGRVNKIARRPQVNVNVLHRLPFSPVNSNKKVLWEKWTQEERLAAFQRNKNKDLQKVRTRLLQEKLKLNHLQSRQRIVQPQIKHKTDGKQQTIMRAKREVQDTKFENIEKQQETQQSGQYFRPKRDIITNAQVQPELVLQPHIKVPYQKENEAQYQEKISEKRGKRQTLYTIIRSPLMFYQKRTTRNPFIPQTNIDDYENVQPDPMEQYRPEPEVVRNDGDSYQISETSDLEYESEYAISMSDSEDWENYPLTTPSGPNPGWHLSTLADIYQKSKRNQPSINQKQTFSHRNSLNQILKLTRVKRSPKQKKRKIGAYKEKLKQRRKIKDMKKKMRIIKITKEEKDKAKDLKDEEIIEDLLKRPKTRKRKTTYQVDKISKEILWSNQTHRIVEDKATTFKWINKTHYRIYKDNATEDWQKQNHVLVFDEEYWNNKTMQEKAKEDIAKKIKEGTKDYGSGYEEDYNEEFTREEEEEWREINRKSDKESRKKKDKAIKKSSVKIEKVTSNDNIEEKSSEEKTVKKKKKLIKKTKLDGKEKDKQTDGLKTSKKHTLDKVEMLKEKKGEKKKRKKNKSIENDIKDVVDKKVEENGDKKRNKNKNELRGGDVKGIDGVEKISDKKEKKDKNKMQSQIEDGYETKISKKRSKKNKAEEIDNSGLMENNEKNKKGNKKSKNDKTGVKEKSIDEKGKKRSKKKVVTNYKNDKDKKNKKIKLE